ncbi:hypothetical protein SEA_SUCHA_34 [Microbacterium phage Sucha]|nr:hypothetical protein SEA_SUCHA_34 [Microbacterium phage Sucha]
MDIYTVLALLLVVFGSSSLLGYWAGAARKQEDRLREKARAFDRGFNEGLNDASTDAHINNPYRRELERRRAR